MLVCDYIVKQIDGEYAHLQNLDGSEEDKLVAKSLAAGWDRRGNEAALRAVTV